MGRKKKDEEILVEELEQSEELLSDEPEELSAEFSEEEKPAEPTPKPARRRRAPKAPVAAAEPATNETQTPAEPAIENIVPAPQPQSVPAIIASTQKDPVVQQWEAAKQTSESIVASLEKVNLLLRDIPEHYSNVLQKSIKQAANRPTPGARAAFGISVFAIVLSILSLSFSQSARQMALTNNSPAPVVAQQYQATESAPALALKPRLKRKTR